MVYSAGITYWCALLFEFLLSILLPGGCYIQMDPEKKETGDKGIFKCKVLDVIMNKRKINIEAIGGITLYLICLISILLFIGSSM